MKFSVIICTYNSAKRLPKTLDAILSQQYYDYEIIIVDGASVDGTLGIIKSYAEKFGGRLEWISEPDRGIYNAINKGVEMSRGEFLNIIGAGDWLEDGALENVAKIIAENPQVDAVFGKTCVWDAELKEKKIVQTMPEELPSHPMQHPALFYKKVLHDKFGLYDESYKIAADYAFCLKTFYIGKVIAVPIDVIVANFVMDGASSQNNLAVLLENIKARKAVGVKTRFLQEFKFYLKKLLRK